ncbi:hypothetical protein WK36_12915 [Burkholderia cepacia]|nr:hypothetical protein WK36_12915 [Burkholderia cepacia]
MCVAGIRDLAVFGPLAREYPFGRLPVLSLFGEACRLPFVRWTFARAFQFKQEAGQVWSEGDDAATGSLDLVVELEASPTEVDILPAQRSPFLTSGTGDQQALQVGAPNWIFDLSNLLKPSMELFAL